jgi:hypothetical protein
VIDRITIHATWATYVLGLLVFAFLVDDRWALLWFAPLLGVHVFLGHHAGRSLFAPSADDERGDGAA